MDRRFITSIVASSACIITLAGCGGDDEMSSPASSESGVESDGSLTAMLDELDGYVTSWEEAESVAEARAAAEAAANLVVGPNGPDHGDRDGDGSVGGEWDQGVLPGLDGTPAGAALPLASNACVDHDVLGGSWDDPATRWKIMQQAIDDWTPNDNTMPSLPSHPMRVVGWATFTLASDSLDVAHAYAGHARLHVDVSAHALDC